MGLRSGQTDGKTVNTLLWPPSRGKTAFQSLSGARWSEGRVHWAPNAGRWEELCTSPPSGRASQQTKASYKKDGTTAF